MVLGDRHPFSLLLRRDFASGRCYRFLFSFVYVVDAKSGTRSNGFWRVDLADVCQVLSSACSSSSLANFLPPLGVDVCEEVDMLLLLP